MLGNLFSPIIIKIDIIAIGKIFIKISEIGIFRSNPPKNFSKALHWVILV